MEEFLLVEGLLMAKKIRRGKEKKIILTKKGI